MAWRFRRCPATECSAVGRTADAAPASVCSARRDARGEVDHLLGQRIQPGGCVDHQIAQLRERLARCARVRDRPCAAATTTRVSRSRRCCGVSGTASSRIWRTLKAWASVVLALVDRGGGTARCRFSPNSSTAKRQFVVAGAYRVVDLDHDGAGTGHRGRPAATAASAFGSAGSTRCAAANSASWRLRLRRRDHSSNTDHERARSPPASPATRTSSVLNQRIPSRGRGSGPSRPWGRRDRRPRPAADRAGRAQPRLRRSASTSTPPGGRGRRQQGIGAVGGGHRQQSVVNRRNRWSAWWPGPSPRPATRRTSPRTRPRAGPCGRCRACRSRSSPRSCPNRSARWPRPPHNRLPRNGGPTGGGGCEQEACGQYREGHTEQTGDCACRQSGEHAGAPRRRHVRTAAPLLADCAAVATQRDTFDPYDDFDRQRLVRGAAEECRAGRNQADGHRAPHRLRQGPRPCPALALRCAGSPTRPRWSVPGTATPRAPG